MIGRKRRQPRPPITESAAASMFSRRAVLIGAGQAGLAALLAGRMGYVAIAQNQRYSDLAESNRVQMRLIPPRRGWIVDRHGQPMAVNRSDFRVDIIPQQFENPEATLKLLAQLLDLDGDDLDRVLRELKDSRGFKPVEVAESIPYERYAAVTVRLPELPGVQATRGFSRFYPAGPANEENGT